MLIDAVYSDIKARVENGYLRKTPWEAAAGVNRQISNDDRIVFTDRGRITLVPYPTRPARPPEPENSEANGPSITLKKWRRSG